MASPLTIPLNESDREDEIRPTRGDEARNYVGCMRPAKRFLCCCPLQVGVYTIATISIIIGILDLLGLLSSCSSPWLLSTPNDKDGPAMMVPADPFLSLVVWIIRCGMRLFTAALAFQVGRLAWRAANELDALVAKQTIVWVWVWTGVTTAVNALPLIALLVVARAINLINHQRLQGAVLFQESKGMEHDPDFIFGVLLVLVVVLISWPIFWGTLANYYLWSFKERLLHGESMLVLMGTREAVVNTDQPTVIVADTSGVFGGSSEHDALAAGLV